MGPVLYCGDPHAQFRHIIEAAGQKKASAVVLLGDMEPDRPLHIELAPVIKRAVPPYWIPGNHDADSDDLYARVWGGELASHNIHGRVVTLPDGTRVAGLGGVFRSEVWYPDPRGEREVEPLFRNRAEHNQALEYRSRWPKSEQRKHWGTIYPAEVEAMADLEADVLVTHEAGGYHPLGFEEIDRLARQLGVKVHVHGHQHDALYRTQDLSARWARQGFRSYGVGLRGITAIAVAGEATIIVPGEIDAERGESRKANA